MASELQLTKTRLYRVDQDIALAVYQADEGRRSRIVQTVVGLGIERSGLVETVFWALTLSSGTVPAYNSSSRAFRAPLPIWMRRLGLLRIVGTREMARS